MPICRHAKLVVALAVTLPILVSRVGAEEFVDPTCPNATVPTRAFASATHHLPQPIDRLLDASHAVSHEYAVCAADYRSRSALENMNYALVLQARSDLWAATLEGRYGRLEAAHRDLGRVFAATDLVLGYKDRATDPGPDNNAAGGGAVMDMRRDSVPSRFDAQAKSISAEGHAILASLAASPAPVTAPAVKAVPSDSGTP